MSREACAQAGSSVTRLLLNSTSGGLREGDGPVRELLDDGLLVAGEVGRFQALESVADFSSRHVRDGVPTVLAEPQ